MTRPLRFDPHRMVPGESRASGAAVLRRWWMDLVTRRGWMVTGFGVLCLLLAYMLGRHELMALGCAMLALLAAAWLVVRFGTTHTAIQRTLPQEPVNVGDVVEVSVHSPDRATLREVLPEGYPPTPVFQAPGRFEYEIVFRQRGVHRLGPAQQVVGDPCGLLEGLVDAGNADAIAVRAEIHDLARATPHGERMLTGEARHHHSAEVDYYDVGIRDHRQGDSLRQVHWKATARHGKLMVRQENYVSTAHGLIVLDRRQAVWHTPADLLIEIPQAAAAPLRSTYRFEKALSLACSIAALSASRGYQLQVQDTTGLELSAHLAHGISANAALESLENFHAATAALALQGTSHQPDGPELLGDSLHKTLLGFADEPVFLILGQLTTPQARWLATLSSSVRNVHVFVLDAHPDQARRLAGHFATGSWRFHAPAHGQSVPEIWGTA